MTEPIQMLQQLSRQRWNGPRPGHPPPPHSYMPAAKSPQPPADYILSDATPLPGQSSRTQRTQRIIALLFGILIGGLLSAFVFAFLN